MPWWAILLSSLVTAALTGGGMARLLLIRRDGEKLAAETDNIEANVTDINWQRFQREINRLDKRVKALEDECADLRRSNRECERERARLESENFRLKAAQDSRGEIRERAAQIVALDRLEGQ